MKKLLLFLLLSLPAFATKTISSSVCFQDAQANCLNAGYIVFQLNQGAKLITSGQVVGTPAITVTLTAGGLIPGGTLIIANDELQPTGTYYITRIFNSNNTLVRGPENWIISGSSPVDLAGETNSMLPDPGLGNPVLQNPSSAQSITGFPLTLTSSAPLILQGSTTDTGAITINSPGTLTNSQTGNFTNTQMNLYVQSLLNGATPTAEFHRSFPAQNSTEAISAASTIGAGSTVFQHNNLASYINNSSTSTAAVSLFGQCVSLLTGSRCWGLNTVTTTTAGQALTSGFYGAELDLNVNNATDAPVGTLINGIWTAQPTSSYGIQIAAPGGGFHWNYGLRFETGATIAPSSTNAALWLQPVASGTNQVSQGIEFVSNDPVSGTNLGSVNLSAAGNLQVQVSKAGAGLSAQLINTTLLSGVAADGSGFKHKRGTAGCATAASAGATCTTTVTWTTAFADANYTVSCIGDLVTSGVPVNGGLTAKAAGSVTFQTVAGTAAAAQYTNIECTAVHD